MSEEETPKEVAPAETGVAPEASAELSEITEVWPKEVHELDFGPSPSIKDYIQSSDAPSRYLMILSLLFGLLAAACFVLLITHYLAYRREAKKLAAPKVVTEPFKPETSFHEELGEFVIDWEGYEMRADLTVECSEAETCAEVKERNAESRDAIFPLLQASSQNEILNPDHKQHLKERMTEKLNELKLKGTILQVNFTNLEIEPRKIPAKN